MCCFGSTYENEDDVYFATLKRDSLPIEPKTIEKAKKNHAYSLFIIGDEYYRKGLLSEAGNTSNWYRKSFTWYTKAADEGYPDAQFNLGYMYENSIGVREQDYNLAIEYYIKAATLGYTSAFYRLGYIYEKGIGVIENIKEAFEWYEKAAEQGDIFAQFKVGSMYKSGTGVPVDPIKALTWFTCCANQGDRDAQIEITKLENQGYYIGEKRAKQTLVKKTKPSSRNNSVYRQHENERKIERKTEREQHRLSIISKKSSNSYYDCIEFTRTGTSNNYAQQLQKRNEEPATHKSHYVYKPNLKDNVTSIKTVRPNGRPRESKVYVDDDDCDRDFNLDDDHPEYDIYYDDPNERM